MKKIIKVFGLAMSFSILTVTNSVWATNTKESNTFYDILDTQNMEENKLEDRYQREIQQNLSTESLNIIKEAKQQASEQRNKQQYDLPASKVTYKILFTVLGDVTFQPNNQKHSVLTEEEKQFAPRVADELEQCFG